MAGGPAPAIPNREGRVMEGSSSQRPNPRTAAGTCCKEWGGRGRAETEKGALRSAQEVPRESWLGSQSAFWNAT